MFEDRFRARRIPGTLSLAVTNLIAAGVLLDPGSMRDQQIHTVSVAIMPPWLWGLAFLVGGLGMVVAAGTMRLMILHIFGTLSLATWTAMTVAAFLADATNTRYQTSPIGVAMFVWMLTGPLAMLLVPLLAERYDQQRRAGNRD